MGLFDVIRKWFKPSSNDKQSKPKDHPSWIVKGGRVYHLYPGCPSCARSGKKPMQTTVSKARAMGLQECKMCHEMIDRAHRV